MIKMTYLSNDYLSWNKLPKIYPDKICALDMPKLPKVEYCPLLVQGNARSYGDVCLLNKGTLLSARSLNHFIGFDSANGVLTAQAGVLLKDILSIIVPQGWFLSVTPGTSLVTLGGAVANDVHGKNHHVAGSFGNHIRRLVVVRSSGEILECTPQQNSELYQATIGGLGLTGLITEVEIQLQKINNPLMWCENHAFANLEEYWQLNDEMQSIWPCSASWVDCLAKKDTMGRGVMFLGRHASSNNMPFASTSRQLNVPIEPPISLINKASLLAFNELYYFKNKKNKSFFSNYQPFFYPLDGILNWNRIYGKKGFYQYQCVIPKAYEKEGIKELLTEIQKSGQGSFLAVLKSFGDIEPVGMMSFPMEGTTLALDFPNLNDKTLSLFSRLDAIVKAAEGRLYPAKDARMPKEMFESGFDAAIERFEAFVDPQFCSNFWSRVR